MRWPTYLTLHCCRSKNTGFVVPSGAGLEQQQAQLVVVDFVVVEMEIED